MTTTEALGVSYEWIMFVVTERDYRLLTGGKVARSIMIITDGEEKEENEKVRKRKLIKLSPYGEMLSLG